MRIGLTKTENPAKHQFYVEWLKSNESIDIIELSWVKDNLHELRTCDGLVLSGGIDIHPKFYGSDKTDYEGVPESFDEKRDDFEIAAYQLAHEIKIPVLGICRGMQLINVIHNGTLVQNLEELELSEVHKGEPDKLHEVNVCEGTILQSWTARTEGPVNSAHHQSIDILGQGLKVNSMAEDGIIEGIELADNSDRSFMLGIQWHPERMFRFELQGSAFSTNIRNRFVEEIRKSIDSKDKKNENH